jgi:hypothetical protein
MSDVKGQLLMISDIEGCLKTNPNNNLEQNVSLCDINNYYENGPLYKFLKKNEKNHIAFLGDYFDKGSGVVHSIIGIAYLHRTFKGQVHIILGNRDINKFRLAYEFSLSDNQLPSDGDDVWGDWINNNFTKNFVNEKNDKKKLFELIMTSSMGAMNAGDDSKKIHSDLSNDKSIDWLLSVFDPLTKIKVVSQFSNDVNKELFVYSCRYLLKHGKLVEIVNDFSVLMSHAGGFHNCILQNNSFFENIMENIPDDAKYFTKMELCRVGLQSCDDVTKYIQIVNDNKSVIQQSVDLHNGFYNTFIETFFDDSLNVIKLDTPSNEYFLLQAMGLKSDGTKEFASYITSCGGGCGITIPTSDSDNYSKYLTSVKNGELYAIAHGHIPICMPHPLIFKRKISNSDDVIVFIENDTSNGIRPKRDDGSLKELPLSYINLNNEGITSYGVGILDENGIIQNMTNSKYDVNGNPDGKNDEDVKMLGLSGPIMPGTELYKTMYFDYEIKDIIKTSGNWPSVTKWNGYVDPQSTTGGKRRTKKNKISRKYKKRFGKRTKKNHPKKHTCRRCH